MERTSFHQPSIRPKTSTMILLCEHPAAAAGAKVENSFSFSKAAGRLLPRPGAPGLAMFETWGFTRSGTPRVGTARDMNLSSEEILGCCLKLPGLGKRETWGTRIYRSVPPPGV